MPGRGLLAWKVITEVVSKLMGAILLNRNFYYLVEYPRMSINLYSNMHNTRQKLITNLYHIKCLAYGP